ncbi:MAG TPA: alkaline phosphatase family protein [Candidatus Nitrosotalea sp.]|nr:alkaline phosphatase family protein [Candidatus Nitrosotalea sp.]
MKRIETAIGGSLALALVLNGCTGGAGSAMPGVSGSSASLPANISQNGVLGNTAPWSGKIKHVVIIFQENRTIDNLFNGYPGADSQSWGLDHNGKRVNLVDVSETAPYDISHTHPSFTREYDNGKLDGWDLASTKCGNPAACPPPNRRAYGKVPRSESKPYWDMAKQWVLGDRMFETNQGPSFPAHQYIISATSTPSNRSQYRASENPQAPNHAGGAGGCDSPTGSTVKLIDQSGNENQTTYPCFDRTTLTDLLDNQGLSWRYYEEKYGSGLWYALDAIKHVRQAPGYKTKVVAPSDQVVTDIQSGTLESVTWITPAADDSDHARVTDGSGPSWVASIVNAIGQSSYWDSTAIIVTWDDWGGWYDHVSPPMYNSFELGFRVPLLVISPYAKQSYVSHKQHEFGSILKFAEETFGLGSLNTTDVRADDLSDCFDFKQSPRQFVPIQIPAGPNLGKNASPAAVVDDDY